ncbi:hypothetical protein DFH06DRAFT_772354 [Mycena polygramma]|nr:hypothetical protein DFH06DRAFT_772354 [Mycena polygramma]
MSTMPPGQPSPSPIYRYGVLVAVLFFGAIFGKVFVSSRLDRQRRRRARVQQGEGDFDASMKPPIFDAYLCARSRPAEAEADRWNDMMPLCVSNISAEHQPPAAKGGQGGAVLLSVSMVVRMPVPSLSAPRLLAEKEEEEAQVPYVELGVAQVEPRGALGV